MRGAMQGWKRVRMAGPGAAVSAPALSLAPAALALTLALALLAPPALAAAPLPEKLGDCVDYKASGDGTVLFNRCNVDLTVRYCCTGPNVHFRWRCAGGRAARKGAHQWLPATAQGRLPQTHPMACDAEAGWRRAACAVQDGAFGATVGPYNWNGRRSDPGMRCTDPQTAGAASAEAPAEDAAKKGDDPEATGKKAASGQEVEKKATAPVDAAKKDIPKEAQAAARPAPQEAAKPAAEPDLALQNPLWIQQWLARLGFDPGPLDGVAGAQTRAALRLWQAARGYPATGVLTAEQALVLGGLKPAPNAASGKAPAGRTAPKAATPPADRTAARTAPKETPKTAPKTAPKAARAPARVNLKPKCSAKNHKPGERCWQEVPGRSGCYVWDLRNTFGGGRATGTCADGVAQGRWVWRWAYEGSTSQGSYANGRKHGRWVLRWRDGTVFEIPYRNGKRHGRAITRWAGPDGVVEEVPYVNDKPQGRGVTRYHGKIGVVCQYYPDKKSKCHFP